MKDHIEHPDVTAANQTGYPKQEIKPESAGTDVQGSELFVGDSIIKLPEGEVLLEENLEDYVIEKLGWVYSTAE